MKRLLERINMRNIVIVFLCITVILMAIGYSILSMELKKEDPFYDVSFTSVTQTTSVKGGNTNPEGKYKIKSSGQRVNFNFILNNPYDEIMYQITIKNNGNIPVEIKDIIEAPEYANNDKVKGLISPIKISYNDVTETILEPDEETEINLVVQYTQGEAKKMNVDYSLILATGSPNQ